MVSEIKITAADLDMASEAMNQVADKENIGLLVIAVNRDNGAASYAYRRMGDAEALYNATCVADWMRVDQAAEDCDDADCDCAGELLTEEEIAAQLRAEVRDLAKSAKRAGYSPMRIDSVTIDPKSGDLAIKVKAQADAMPVPDSEELPS
jgi:hypothetical protein